MKQLHPYLNFDGNCEEALHFYQAAFGGEIKELNRFEGMDANLPAEYKNRVLHAHFIAGELEFMASDIMPEQGYAIAIGNNLTLTIVLDSEAEQTKIFEALAQGGEVIMPLEDTFWNARYGMLVDKFGFSWALNCEKK